MTLELGGIEALTVTAGSAARGHDLKEVGSSISAEEFVNTPSFNRSFSRLPRHGPRSMSVSTSTFGDTISVGGQGARNSRLRWTGPTTTTV